MASGEDVQNSPDAKTDEDFKGFPGGQASKEMIAPETATEKTHAAVEVIDGDKMTDAQKEHAQDKVAETNEALSDGSGGAFGATEQVSDQG